MAEKSTDRMRLWCQNCLKHTLEHILGKKRKDVPLGLTLPQHDSRSFSRTVVPGWRHRQGGVGVAGVRFHGLKWWFRYGCITEEGESDEVEDGWCALRV